MGRRYDDDVQVQLDLREESPGPGAFIWQERLYQVREVLGHWYERTPWWEEAAERGLDADSGDGEVWRVAASAGRARGAGTYDLRRSPASGEPDAGWQLLQVVD